jgi:uncharacterized protein (UPF0332 family)
MDNSRVQQAEQYIRECKADNRVRKQPVEHIVSTTYKNNQEESLRLAQIIYETKGSVLWIVVTSYYAMFYAANRALTTQGIKISGQSRHKTTVEALIVFLRKDIRDEFLSEYEDAVAQALDLIENFEYERKKRGSIQYQTSPQIKRAQAKTSYQRAIQFCTVMDRI